MYNPITTYRIQFNKAFTFKDLDGIIPYLHKLGVSTIYASPIFEAVPGSTHGYDGLNPLKINPEIGTEEELLIISKKLKSYNIGWVQDIVPNHMAFDTRNPWLYDVLEKGAQSLYTSFFDIASQQSIYEGPLMVPFLGTSLEEAIIKNEIEIIYQNHRLHFKYHESFFPLHSRSYATVFSGADEEPPETLAQWLQQFQILNATQDSKMLSANWDALLVQLTQLVESVAVQKYIDGCLFAVNNSNEAIHHIAGQQVYRLCHWQQTAQQINYRRFFTVNGLICLNMQHPHVFEQYHQYIFSLIKQGVFQGLRIDHIDGLYDPTYYLEELRKHVGNETYLIVEKILNQQEELPANWPVEGTSGYEFLAAVNNLLTNKKAQKALTQFYYCLVQEYKTVPQQVRDKKALVLYHHMGGELENLYHIFMQLVKPEWYPTMRTENIKTAIAEFLIHCPVYRFYGNQLPLPDKEKVLVQEVFNRVKESRPDLVQAVHLLEKVVLYNVHERDEYYSGNVLHFYKRCMQYAGPLMAKGVEDTLMYTFNRFIAHNEVGDAPDAFGMSVNSFHKIMKERQRCWPLSLNTTSTHDTKRGEDFRARLNILTDLPNEWLHKVAEWQIITKDLKKNGVPNSNDEYFIYQTLIGSFPVNKEEQKEYGNRLKEYLQKALREAKQNSNWTTPDETYETATTSFALSLLDEDKPFWKSFYSFFLEVADHGIINSLAQILLKFTCPGVPDVYQGCELWDLSFVDPDNRRPVDYKKREQLLKEITNTQNREELLKKLWTSRNDARIKLWLVRSLMNLRRQHTEVFEQGAYIPLQITGRYNEDVFAFARIFKQTCCIIAVPLGATKLCKNQNVTIEKIDWKDTAIQFPKGARGKWKNVLNDFEGEGKEEILIQNLFKIVPFAVLETAVQENERGSGILLHITSLPSPFGIGDLGPEAKAFADFLYRTKQKFWQVLPLNPTEGGQGHSPYSATSSRAGNTLLISLESLAEGGLLDKIELQKAHLSQTGKVDFVEAEKVKCTWLQKAWEAFKIQKDEVLHKDFDLFYEKEKAWLNDFALYTFLKDLHAGKPWYEWPLNFKLYNVENLKQLAAQNEEKLQKIKWLQFIFSKQWHQLKGHCNKRGIALIGDIPFYISYDSADVWANRKIFSLDDEGCRTGIAGVPPDAFSADGQLWGMPVFNWDVLKVQNYLWWIERLKKNNELFDVVRLDHFRAFEGYWQVPAGAKTAKSGEWKKGPGNDFFIKAKEALGNLHFLAEDLGEVNEQVFNLRDEFGMPGMKILQFAFGENFQSSDYIPHNYTPDFFVYTGTHDNNTVLGWYRNEADETVRSSINKYAGREVAEHEVAHVFCRMAFASVAKTAIIPLQDLLELDAASRMNTPATAKGNWNWRLLPYQLTKEAENNLKELTLTYNRS